MLGSTLIHSAPSLRWQVCSAWSPAQPLSVLVDHTTIITIRQLLSARQLDLAIFLRSLGSLRLAPALSSATSQWNGSSSCSLKGIRYLQCSTLTVSYLHLLVLCLAPCSHHVCFLGSTNLCGSRLYCARVQHVSCTFWLSLSVTQSVVAPTHSSLQRSTVMLRQPVLGSFQPVTPALVTTGTSILHLSQYSPCSRATSSDSHHPTLHEFAHTDATTGFLLQRNTFIHSVFRRSAYVCKHSVAQHFHYSHVNVASCIESSHLWMSHIESECVMLPLDVSCYLWMHHVILNQVTSDWVMLPRFTLSSVTYTYTYIEKPLRVSYISTVLASVVSNGLPPTLHLKFL